MVSVSVVEDSLFGQVMSERESATGSAMLQALNHPAGTAVTATQPKSIPDGWGTIWHCVLSKGTISFLLLHCKNGMY